MSRLRNTKAKDYADKEVLRELKNMKKVLAKKSFSEHCIEELDKRIKELTEEID